jgi:diguanylate cyclase (GGDEF)-like protein
LRETVSRIEQRVLEYEQMLRGVQSLFATTHLNNRLAVHDYVETLQIDANFAGTQNIGVVQWVTAQRRPKHLATLHAAGLSSYAIQPDGLREAYAPIIQREPDMGRHFAPLGSDVWPHPMLRHALEKARDSGRAAISGKMQWQGEAGTGAALGFAMCLPVYERGKSHDNVDERRAHLTGWVYATFRMNDFMASLYGSQSPGLTLAVYDGTDTVDASLLHRTSGDAMGQPAVSANEYMVVAGHNWTLLLSTQKAFEDRYDRDTETVAASVGVVLSLLLALLTWLMLNGRNRALRLAQAMTQELRHMAHHDLLTNLPNRALFGDRLNQELARAKRQHGRFAMLFIDLDYFKPINDHFGHDVGDLVLRQVAVQLQSCVRATDTVGRMGGDEFVVLMAELSPTDAILALAEKLHQAVHQPFVVDGHELSISCSIGVAVYPDNAADVLALTKCADDAMYRAKKDGRNCVRLCDITA